MSTPSIGQCAETLLQSIEGDVTSLGDQKVSDVFRSSLQEFQKATGSLDDEKRKELISKLQNTRQENVTSSQGIIARICLSLAGFFRTSTQDLIDETIAKLVLSNESQFRIFTEKSCRAVVPLINTNVDEEVVQAIFTKVVSCPEDEQARICSKLASLIAPAVTKDVLLEIVEFLKENPSIGIASYLGDFGDSWFLRDARSILEEGIAPGKVKETLQDIKNLSFWHRKSICEGAKSLIQAGVPKDEILGVLPGIRSILKGERENVIERAKKLIHGEMEGAEIEVILHGVEDIPREERENVVENTLKIINKGMKGDTIVELLSSVEKIPKGKRENVVENALKTIKQEMSAQQIASILSKEQDSLKES